MFVHDPPSWSGSSEVGSHRTDLALEWKVSLCQGMESSLNILYVLIFWDALKQVKTIVLTEYEMGNQ